MNKTILAFILTLSFVAQSTAQTQTKANSPAQKAADNITAAQMKDYLSFIASDEMEGRDTPSRGLNTTAKFIATELSRWGVKPAGDDNTYFQKIVLRGTVPDAAGSGLDLNAQKFVYGDDFIRLLGATETPVNAPLVYGGSGWFVKAKNVDAFAGVDVKGKIVVLSGAGIPSNFALTPLPNGITRADLTGTRGTDWIDPAMNAMSKGAVGIIVIASTEATESWSVMRDYFGRARFTVDKFSAAGEANRRGGSSFPVVVASRRTAEAMFANEKTNPVAATAATTAFDLSADKKATLKLASKTVNETTQNVVGMIEGSDNALKAEIVAVGAHYDHIGMNPLSTTDKISNGADDDGSGTTAILAMAEALAKSPKKPKRSVLFVWHCGEEKGLWGSQYFTEYPTVDLKNVVTQLNIDMIGRSRFPNDANPQNAELSTPNEVYVIGSKMQSTELGTLSETVNNAYLKLNFNYRYDDEKDPNRFFYRSDHFNYARKGVPIIFYFDGVHEDYHRPSDEVSKIDFEKMQRVTRTVFLTMWEIGDLKARPVIDKQIPAERLQR